MRRFLVPLVFAAGCAAPVREVGRIAAPEPPVAPVPVVEETAPSPVLAEILPARAEGVTRNVIIVAIDGVRWQEVFHGVDAAQADAIGFSSEQVVDGRSLMPNVHAMADRGVAVGAPGVGEPISASGPNFASLPGYNELLSGRAPTCQKNDCAQTTEQTLLDACKELPGETPVNVGLVSSWENLELAASPATGAFFLSAGRHHTWQPRATRDDKIAALLTRSEKSFPTPGQFDYRPDRVTAQLALRFVEVARPRCAFLGLGDADELAHLGDYPGYLSAIRASDKFVGDLQKTLAQLGDYGATTTVIVTTDHGRADSVNGHGAKYPESGRVWLVAAGGAVPKRGAVALAEPAKLADVAPTARKLLGLPDATFDDRSGKPLRELLP